MSLFALHGLAADTVLLLVRLAGFMAMTLFLLRRVIPLSAFFLLGAAFIALAAPLLLGRMPTGGGEIVIAVDGGGLLTSSAGARVSMSGLAAQVGFGLFFGLTASLSFLFARLCATWSGALVFSSLMPDAFDPDDYPIYSTWSGVIMLMLLTAMTPGVSGLFETLLQSLAEAPLRAELGTLSAVSLKELVQSAGSLSLSVSLLVLLPSFAGMLLTVLVTAAIHRACPKLHAEQLFRVAVVPILCLVISFGLLRFGILSGDLSLQRISATQGGGPHGR